MRQARGRSGLDEEPLHELLIVAQQKLDRDLATELGIAREKHLTHAAARELADQAEPADLHVLREIERRVLLRRHDEPVTVGMDRCRSVVCDVAARGSSWQERGALPRRSLLDIARQAKVPVVGASLHS